MSSTFEYNVTGSGGIQFGDNTSDEWTTTVERLGCSELGEGGRELRWGMLGLSIVIVATASGNILVCLAVSWERRLQNMTNYFLMSLAIADLLVSLLVMPLAMIVEIFGCFPLARSLCVIWATMDVLLCTASIWHMCTMSMDRYFTIRYPIRYGRNKTRKMMTLKITFVWIVSFAVSAPLAIAGFVDYNNVYNNGKCLPSIKNFVLYGSIFAFYVPLIIMVTTYTLTIRILRQNRVLMSGLQSKYHFQVPAVSGERHRTIGGLPRSSNGLSKMDESTRMSCPDLSPPRSSFTITSVGRASPKGSNVGRAVLSPCGDRRAINAARSNRQKLRTQMLKVNLTDEANYVNCNFDQLLLKRVEDDKPVEHRRRQSLAIKLKAFSPKHSKPRFIRRGSQPNAARSRIAEPTDSWNPSLMLVRITRYYSDSDLPGLRSNYLHRKLDTYCDTSDEKTPNGFGRYVDRAETKATRNGALVPPPPVNNCYAPLKDPRLCHQPMSPGCTRGTDDLDSSLVCFEEGELVKRKAPSCLTTQTTTTTDTSRATSPFPVDGASTSSVGGRDLDTPQLGRSSTTNGRGFDEKQTKDGVDGHRGPPTSAGPHPNGSAKTPPGRSIGARGDAEKEEQDEIRGLLATPSRRQCTPRPSTIIGPWSGGGGGGGGLGSGPRSPSIINTSPSSSESRAAAQRARFNLGRTTRKSPSGCARKIGLMSKNRSNNERKASKVLGIIFAVFVLSWTPFFAMNIISVLCDRCMDSITDSVVASMVWLGYLSSLANPIIYTMFSTSFRTVFYRILSCQYSSRNIACGSAAGQMSSRALSSEERYLCWSKSGRNSGSLKDESSKICGV